MKAWNITCQPSSGWGTAPSLASFVFVIAKSSPNLRSLRRSLVVHFDLLQPDARSFPEVTSLAVREAIFFFPMAVEEAFGVLEEREEGLEL